MAEELDIEILSEKHITNVEAYEILKKIIKKIEEHEGAVPPLLLKTLNYLSHAKKLDPEAASSLKRTLEKYNLKPETIIMIVNICPETVDELRILFEPEERFIDTETTNEILQTVKTYCQQE